MRRPSRRARVRRGIAILCLSGPASYAVAGPPEPPLLVESDIGRDDGDKRRSGPVTVRVRSTRALGPVTIELRDHNRRTVTSLTRPVGTDATVYPHGRNAEEFHLLVNLGMKPVDALKAGTSLDAELLGVADRTGSLENGKLADIVACPGNPEENIRQVEHIRFVMKEGIVYRRAGE